MIANHDEVNFELLRYSLGGYRPSKTARLEMSKAQIHGLLLDSRLVKTGISLGDSKWPDDHSSKSPGYATHDKSEANTRVQ